MTSPPHHRELPFTRYFYIIFINSSSLIIIPNIVCSVARKMLSISSIISKEVKVQWKRCKKHGNKPFSILVSSLDQMIQLFGVGVSIIKMWCIICHSVIPLWGHFTTEPFKGEVICIRLMWQRWIKWSSVTLRLLTALITVRFSLGTKVGGFWIAEVANIFYQVSFVLN